MARRVPPAERPPLRGCLESQPRRGAGIKPGASAPGRGAQRNHQAPKGRRQPTDRLSCLRPFGALGWLGGLFLGLKPQATCLDPFGVGFRDTLSGPRRLFRWFPPAAFPFTAFEVEAMEEAVEDGR